MSDTQRLAQITEELGGFDTALAVNQKIRFLLSEIDRLTSADPVVEEVRRDLLTRAAMGLREYGVGLDRSDLRLRDWLQHAYEETLDQANYLKRAILALDRGEAP